MDLLPQRREGTFRYDGLTEGQAFDVVLFGLDARGGGTLFPARALRLADLPFRVGRLPVAEYGFEMLRVREALIRSEGSSGQGPWRS